MKSPLKFSSEDQDILKPIHRFAKTRKVKLYLVGGILRDLLLSKGKDNLDFDFCLEKGAINFGKKLAKKIKAGFVVLDKEHGACRLVKRIKDRVYTLDFTDFRGKTLEEDLLHRDFTINAMALELEKIKYIFNADNRRLHTDGRRLKHLRKSALDSRKSAFKLFLQNALIDPYRGREDLKHKIIKVVNRKAFVEDPLRILRTFSFASVLGFKIDKETLRLARLEKNKLSRVSYERIRDELFKIFDSLSTYNYLVMMDKLKILKIIFPEIEKMRNVGQGPYHHLDVWQHTLETIRQLEGLIKDLKNNREIQDYLNEIISSERRRRALLKLGALLHDIGKPAALRREDGKIKFHGHERIGLKMTEEIAERLRLSNAELDSLKIIVLRHLRPGYLADNEILTPRARFRYFRDTTTEAASILLLSIADQRATKGPLTTQESRMQQEKTALGLIKEYFQKKREKKVRRLINGNDLMQKFKLEPSPIIGKILSEIEELQAIGKIKTKKEALRIAKRFIK